MIVALDIGNSFTKIGLYDGSRAVMHDIYAKDCVPDYAEISNRFKAQPIEAVAICTVGRHDILEQSAIASGRPIVRLDSATELPFANDYLTPETLGADRKADMLGAAATHPGSSDFLIIDLGTCNTYDTVLAGRFVGGNIAPGLSLRLRAMHEHTAALPSVEPHDNGRLIGRNTREAMESGALIGMADEITGQITRFREAAPRGIVILTGGYADMVKSRIPGRVEYNPNLVLDGLNHLARRTVK